MVIQNKQSNLMSITYTDKYLVNLSFVIVNFIKNGESILCKDFQVTIVISKIWNYIKYCNYYNVNNIVKLLHKT